MRAAVMRGGKMLVDQVPDPEPGPGEVLVKTLSCGICGSDLHMLEHGERLVELARRSGAPFVMDLKRDVVMGHEFCAELVDYGPGTQQRLAKGTRVCSMPVVLRDGAPISIGYSNDVPGGFGEYMVLNEMLLLEVPESLSSAQAALTEPIAVGWHGVEKAVLGGDEVALVIGCGPVGLAVIGALKIRGVGPIVASEPVEARRKMAELVGADIVVDPKQSSPYEALLQVAAPEGASPVPQLMGPAPRPSVIFECVGIPGVIQQVMDGAPRNARIVVVGVCMEPDGFEPMIGIGKELNLQFVLGYSPDEFTASLNHLAEGKIETGPIISDTIGIDDVPAAFEQLTHPNRHAKIIVEP